MPTTTRHGACELSIDELRALHRVRSTRQAIRHTETCEDLLAALARPHAEAAIAGRRIRADQALDSIRRAVARLGDALGDARFAAHALSIVRRQFDAAAERSMRSAARRFPGEPVAPTQSLRSAARGGPQRMAGGRESRAGLRYRA